jgi:hypothetical protein
MFRTKKFAALGWAVAVTALAALSGGCGSSSNHNISEAQAQAISHEVVTAVEASLAGAIPAASVERRSTHPSLSKIVSDIQPEQLSGCTTSGDVTTCNWPVSYSGSCPNGGRIAVAGDITGTLNGSGDGSVGTGPTAPLTITPTNCSVTSNLTINGDPNIVIAATVTITDDAVAFPATLTETGGISYGPNPSGSCTMNVTYTVNSETSCTVSGTLCGQSLSGSC